LHKYRELKVWQRAMAFTITVYRETQGWPQSERYGLTTAIDIARGLEYFSSERADALLAEADEIAAMIVGLMKSLGWRSTLSQAS
jgi:hypothetical protein